MKHFFGLGAAIALALASGPAWAQDLTAGKTPPQLFSSDCSACHRSPAGLAKGRDSRTLAGFLKEHYTTKSENANALAVYVSTYNGREPPPAAGDVRRGRRDAEVAGNGDEFHAGRGDEAQPRRRRTVNLSSEGEKPRPRDNASAQHSAATGSQQTGESAREAIRLPRATPATPSRQREQIDPFEQIRGYLTSGLGLDGLAAEAGKAHPATARRHENDVAQPQSEPAAEPAKSDAEPPAATGTVSAGAASPESAASGGAGAAGAGPAVDPAASPAPGVDPPPAAPPGPASPAPGSADAASAGTAAAGPPPIH